MMPHTSSPSTLGKRPNSRRNARSMSVMRGTKTKRKSLVDDGVRWESTPPSIDDCCFPPPNTTDDGGAPNNPLDADDEDRRRSWTAAAAAAAARGIFRHRHHRIVLRR